MPSANVSDQECGRTTNSVALVSPLLSPGQWIVTCSLYNIEDNSYHFFTSFLFSVVCELNWCPLILLCRDSMILTESSSVAFIPSVRWVMVCAGIVLSCSWMWCTHGQCLSRGLSSPVCPSEPTVKSGMKSSKPDVRNVGVFSLLSKSKTTLDAISRRNILLESLWRNSTHCYCCLLYTSRCV